MAERTVWLVGMMGAGKSSVGPALARALERPFVDSDASIEEALGLSVAEIFDREGEAAFRARERAEIERWAGKAVVVALGGGAIAQPGAAQRLADSGVVVYLRANPDTLLRRLGDCTARPLLRDLAPTARSARLTELLEARQGHYEEAAIVIDTDGVEVPALVETLVRRLAEAGPA